MFIEQKINSRIYTRFNNFEMDLKPNKNYLFDLSYLGILDLRGDKASKLLQGQLSCDVRSLSEKKIVQGAQCNLKGRILALLDVIQWNGVKILLPKDIINTTIKSLNKTALLSRVSFEINNHYKLYGFYLQNHQDLLPDSLNLPKEQYELNDTTSSCCYSLGNQFFVLIIQKQDDLIEKTFIDAGQFLGSLPWHTLRLTQKQIEIYPESQGLFLPHRLGLHKTPYISFNKGCYKGQEIIARTQYKATIKHELMIYKIETEQQLYSGQKIFRAAEDIELGELIDYSILGKNSYLIAVSILKEHPMRVRFEEHKNPILFTEPN